MKQVMKSKADKTTTGGNGWMWALVGSDSAARAVHRCIIDRQRSITGRKSWVWSGAGYKNTTRAGGN